jgi:hypothetical protein
MEDGAHCSWEWEQWRRLRAWELSKQGWRSRDIAVALDVSQGADKAEGKYASAHDLRRAFGTRWARRVVPAVLQRLMRHANIETTMEYYVGLEADELAEELWRTHAPASRFPAPDAGAPRDCPSNAKTAQEPAKGLGRGNDPTPDPEGI